MHSWLPGSGEAMTATWLGRSQPSNYNHGVPEITGNNNGRGPRGPYAKSDAVRAKILDACLEEFSQLGFHGATMKDVAARAEISITGLSHHFPTKADLLDAVLRRRYEHTAAIVQALPRADALKAQAQVIYDNSKRPGIIQLHTTISAEAVNVDHPAHAFYTQRLDDFRQYLTGAFEDARDAGLLKTDAEPAVLASLYIAVQDGLQLQWLYNPDAIDLEEGVRTFVRSIADVEI